nr:MAG TPA: hypothetical protein [Caudoviricetes sp.]
MLCSQQHSVLQRIVPIVYSLKPTTLIIYPNMYISL